MDVDLTIRYSDDRQCEIIPSRPDTAAPLYRIASRRADLWASHTETMREARRPYEITHGRIATALPQVRPELTQLVDAASEADQWLHEIKFDGYRMHARLDRGAVR